MYILTLCSPKLIHSLYEPFVKIRGPLKPRFSISRKHKPGISRPVQKQVPFRHSGRPLAVLSLMMIMIHSSTTCVCCFLERNLSWNSWAPDVFYSHVENLEQGKQQDFRSNRCCSSFAWWVPSSGCNFPFYSQTGALPMFKIPLSIYMTLLKNLTPYK